MALAGWSTSNYLRATASVVSSTTFSISVWVRIGSVSATARNVLNIANSGNITDRYNIVIGTTDLPIFNVSDTASGQVQLIATTPITSGAWYHVGIVSNGAASREIFVSGTSEGTSVISRTPVGLNQTNIGVRGGSAVANPGTGLEIAEICVRDGTVFTATDFAQEAGSASALLVAPATITAYYKMTNSILLGNNMFESFNTSITGTLTDVAHPRIAYPTRPAIV